MSNAPLARFFAPAPRRAPDTDQEGAQRLKIVGAFDALTLRDLGPVFADVAEHHPPRVVVDFEEVTLLDSLGVGLLVSLFKRLRADGAELVVVGAREQPLAVLKVLKLDRLFGL